MGSGIGKAVVGIVVAILFIAIGAIILTALYPISPFTAIGRIILLVVLAIAIVVRFIFRRGSRTQKN